MNFLKATLELEEKGYVVWDQFLSPNDLGSVIGDYEKLREEGKFKAAGIGKGNDFQLNQKVRSDETCWLEPESLSLVQKKLWSQLEEFKNAINQKFFVGLWELEAHYSYYPIGGLYQAHYDRFSKDDSRTISMVLYLNQKWSSEDGGELRIYSKIEGEPPTDILPTGGRLVCFFSSEILHEVLPAKKARYGMAGWWKRRTIPS